MPFTIKHNLDAAIESCDLLVKDQLPFTIARTLTMTAQDVQKDTRELTSRVFKLRNNWTTQNIKITAATKQALVATVYTDTENRETGARDYLPGQQDGFERLPVAGRQHVCIPTNYLRQMVADKPMPDWLRPKAMMRYADLNGRYETTRKRGKKERGSLRRSPQSIQGLVFFMPRDSSGRLVSLTSGAYAIMARHIGDQRRAYPMYLLVAEAHIQARFPMQATAEATVAARIVDNFNHAAAEVLANELLRGTGFRLKF